MNREDCQLPSLFLDRLQAIVSTERFQQVVESFEKPKRTVFRVNTIKTTADRVLEEWSDIRAHIEALPWCSDAFSIEHNRRDDITHSKAATDGRIYVQGASSILASLVLAPEAGEWNLDLAAAPGGKASHIAALMQNSGKLSVVEPIKKRMYRLADNLKRLGVQISKTYLMDGRKVGGKVPDRFDRIMLDAPCSSESRMRAENPDSRSFWSERKIREQSRKQAGLIKSAFQSLKPSGTLLYCTCSFAPEENEVILQTLLDEFPGLARIEKIRLPDSFPSEVIQGGLTGFEGREFDASICNSMRILPNELFDGFFLARIVKEKI